MTLSFEQTFHQWQLHGGSPAFVLDGTRIAAIVLYDCLLPNGSVVPWASFWTRACSPTYVEQGRELGSVVVVGRSDKAPALIQWKHPRVRVQRRVGPIALTFRPISGTPD